MVIKASTAVEVRGLVTALTGDDDLAREAAIARLTVIGARAVDRLVTAFDQVTDRSTRLAILRTLEAIGDYRGGAIARRALIEGGDLGVAATAVLKTLLASSHEESASEALDTLVATALDASNEHRVRLAAVEALEESAGEVGKRVARTVREDKSGKARKPTAQLDVDAARLEATWQDSVEGRLPDDPRLFRNALSAHASTAPLNTLRKLIEAVRLRENEAPRAREAWCALRGALHQALALRGSRVALYDLRESLTESATLSSSVVPSFVGALQLVGDESCLEPLAAMFERSAGDAHRQHQVESAFRAIVRRERISRRHKVMKRLEARGSRQLVFNLLLSE
jgi:hypothetical protein